MMAPSPSFVPNPLLPAQATQPDAPYPPQIAAALREVRQALWPAPERPGAVEIAGEVEFRGFPGRFSLLLAGDGRFRRRIVSRLVLEEGFDGREAWTLDETGIARELVLEEREDLLLGVGVATGSWTDPGGPFVVAPPSETGVGPISFDLRLRGGAREARLEVDRASWLPARLRVKWAFGERVWTFEDFREEEGWVLPHRILQEEAGVVEMRLVASSIAARSAEGRPFARPESRASKAFFDPSVPAAIETRRAPTGHLLVHASVGGRDLGWFILDSGAGEDVIGKEAADSAGMPSLGRTFVAGAGAAVTPTVFREGGLLRLGPLSVERALFMEMDLSTLGGVIGGPIAGILGFGVFARSIVSIEVDASRVEIHDPDRFDGEGLGWERLVLHSRNPFVRAGFEGKEGLFRIDTGAGQVHVMFNSPAVERLRLLEGRALTNVGADGAGGSFEIRLGSVASFELGGRSFGVTPALFALAGSGALDDPNSEGTIGEPLLANFRTIFDYRRGRIAFAPKAGEGNR